MNLDKYNQDLSIAMGVLSALGVVYAFIQTWGWSKRSSRINMDFMTILKFVHFSICNLSNVCFVVAFGTSLWWLIFYKVRSFLFKLSFPLNYVWKWVGNCRRNNTFLGSIEKHYKRGQVLCCTATIQNESSESESALPFYALPVIPFATCYFC